MSDRNYFAAKLYQFGGLLLTDTPYSNAWVHPVIDYNYIVGAPVLGGELSFNAHARAMTRSDSTDTNRAVLEANWRRKMIDPIGQVWTPFAHAARRCLQLLRRARSRDAGAAADDTVLRGVAAAGVLYSYPFVAHTASASHVIAPTAQIIVRQNQVDQRRLPDEDAKSLIFDDTLLFDIDKFSGYDRFETGTRANVGMQYTLQANNGIYARVRVRPELPCRRREPLRRSGPRPDRQVQLSRRSAASRPTAPTTSPASICRRSRASASSPRPASTRRIGACGATTRSLHGQLWPAVRLGGLHLHAFRSCDRPDRQSAGHHGQRSA